MVAILWVAGAYPGVALTAYYYKELVQNCT